MDLGADGGGVLLVDNAVDDVGEEGLKDGRAEVLREGDLGAGGVERLLDRVLSGLRANSVLIHKRPIRKQKEAE